MTLHTQQFDTHLFTLEDALVEEGEFLWNCTSMTQVKKLFYTNIVALIWLYCTHMYIYGYTCTYMYM